MKNMAKRIMALVLAVAMIITSLPTNLVSAAEANPIPMNVKVGESFTLKFADGTTVSPSDFKQNGKLEFDRNVFDSQGQIPCEVKSTAKTGVYTLKLTNKQGVTTTWVITVGPANGTTPEPEYDYTLYGKQSVTLDQHQGNEYIDEDSIKVSNIDVVKTSYNGFINLGVDEVKVKGKNVGTSTVEFKSYSWGFSWGFMYKKDWNLDKYSFKVVESDTVLNGTITDTMYVGEKANLNITAAPAAGQGAFIKAPTVSYETTNANIAKIENGKLVAVAPGTVTITANATNGLTGDAYTGASKDFEVTVKAGEVEKVEITNKKSTIKNTETYDFNERVTVKGNASQEVTWSVNDEKVATIDSEGKLTPNFGNATVVVTATSVADPTKSDSCEVRINWDNQAGGSIWENINILVVDENDEPIEGAYLTTRLEETVLFGRNKIDSFNTYSDQTGKSYVKIDSYEYLVDVKAEKEGYETTTKVVDKYIGALAGHYEYVKVVMKSIVKHDVTFKYVDQANQIDHEIYTVQVSEGSKVSESDLTAAEDAAKAYAEELNKINKDYIYEFAGFEPNVTNVEINDDTVVLATYEKKYVGEEIAYVNYTTQSGMTAPENEIRDLRQTKAIGNIAATLTDKDGRVYENVKVLCEGKVVAHFDLETQTLVTDPEFAARELDYKETITLQVEIDEEIVFVDQKLRLNNEFYDFYLVDGTKVEGQYVEANADYAKDNYAEYGKEYEKLGYLISSKSNLNKVSDTWYIVSYQALIVDVNYIEDENNETLKESQSVVVPFNSKVASNHKHTEEQMRKYAQVEALVLNSLEANNKQWTLKETKYENGHLGSSKGWNKNTITCVYTRHFEQPVELVHELWFDCDGLNKTAIEISRKTVEGKEIEQKQTVLETYKPYALQDGYILDEQWLKEDAITTDGDKTVVTFKYWANGIKWNYYCETVNNIELPSWRIFKYDANAFVENGVVSAEKVKSVLDKFEATAPIFVGNTKYILDTITINNSHKEHFVDVTLNYVYDKASDCNHNCAHHFVDVDNTCHKEICDNCDSEIKTEAHNYSEKTELGTVCINCGHKRTIEETIKATPRSLSDFSEETMTRILAEAKDDLEDKTDKYFVEKDPSAQYALADLSNLVLNLVTDNGNYRKYEGAMVVNGVYFNYELECSLMRSGRKKQPVKIADPLLAQGSELLNDLRTNRPYDLITRAEFIGVLANLFQVPEDRMYDKNWDLTGCAQEQQIKNYATYIIVKGYSDEEFGQNDTITVEQMYTILSRALQFQAKVAKMTTDEIKAELAKANYTAEVSDWAMEGVSVAIKVGIAAATETAPTEPQNGVMRITAADTLQKYIEVVAAPTAETEVKVVEEK